MNKDISAVLLAGGENNRFFGFNKTFLKVGNRRVIDLILDTISKIFSEVIIVTNKFSEFSEFRDFKIVSDLKKNCGPLGGIYTGLKTITTEFAFFVACDMPFVQEKIINKILKIAHNRNELCFVPYTQKGLEPLCALYSKKIIPYIDEAIRKKNFSVSNLIRKLPSCYIKLNKEELKMLTNINAPDDLLTRLAVEV